MANSMNRVMARGLIDKTNRIIPVAFTRSQATFLVDMIEGTFECGPNCELFEELLCVDITTDAAPCNRIGHQLMDLLTESRK